MQSAYGSHRRLSIYDTEYGYVTHPPNAGTGYLSPSTAAGYLNWTEYLTWRDPRIASTMQYLLYDPNPNPPTPDVFGHGGFATGLIFYDRKLKPTFYAYRMPIFLPALWLFAIYIGDAAAAALGAVWIIGRILYWNGYRQAANKRSMGFAVQALVCFALWLGALGAIVWKITNG